MKKVDIYKNCDYFLVEIRRIMRYVELCQVAMKEEDLLLSYSYEYAIIALYKHFEMFILQTTIGCINRDNDQVKETYGVDFGKHINDDICEFIITGGGYFNFRNTPDLLKTLKQNIGENHPVREIIKKADYRNTIEKICALRNFAAHSSETAKNAAKKALRTQRVRSAGSWLKKQNRFNQIVDSIKAMTLEIKDLYS